MKVSVLILLLFLFCGTSFPQSQAPMSGAKYCSMLKSGMNRVPYMMENTGTLGKHTYDVLDYTLAVNLYHCYFSPYPSDFMGSVIITFRVDSTLNRIKLNAAASSLNIDSVRLAGASFTRTGDTLYVTLNRTYSPNEIALVKIYYHHLNVWDNAVFAENGMLFTMTEPECARNWFPCWDKPSDKATLDFTAKVRSNVKLGSNGKLMDSVFHGDTLIYHWHSNQNIATYLINFISKIGYNLDILYWHKLSNPADSIPIRFYYNNDASPAAMEAIIKPLMTYYSQTFCEHPFQKNGFGALNDQFGYGGMENQTLTSLCPYCWVTWIIAHEFAHQWFGDMITCGTWADVWLNESFATWCEASYDEHNGGYTSYKNDIVGDANDYLAYNPGWAISNPAWAVNTPPMGVLFNTQITYEKGACVLHMLRHILGDGPFFATLQAYCADTNLKFKSAVTSDFTAVINRVTSADYSWFINQWIYYPNHPNYLNNYFYEDHGNGHWTVAFLTTQVQTNAPFFKMPMELSIHFASGSDTLITVMNDVNTQEYNWTFNRQPLTLTFDPNNDIVLKQASTVQGKVWTGSVSDDWNVAGNWNLSGVPTTESARIPTVSTHMPVVKNTGMSCGSLSIEAGATLTINAGKNLTVNGKLLVAGSTSMVLKP